MKGENYAAAQRNGWEWNTCYKPHKLSADDMRLWISEGTHRKHDGRNKIATHMRISYLQDAIAVGLVSQENIGRARATLDNLRGQL